MNHLPKEVWLPVVGYEGQYEVSSRGRVRSKTRVIQVITQANKTITRRIKGRILSPIRKPSGHLIVELGYRNKQLIHNLVMAAFEGPRPKGSVTRHLDGNPACNWYCNLAYGTQSENMHDRTHHGTHGKLSPEKILEIKRRIANAAYGDLSTIAKEENVSPRTISRIKSGESHGQIK